MNRKPAPSDQLIASLLREGDREEVFHQIFKAYYQPVYTFFIRRGFPPDECHDFVQDTFLQVHKGLDDFRAEAAFSTWLFRIAANIWRNALRYKAAGMRQAPEVSFEETLTGEEPSPIDGARSDEEGPLDRVLAEERARLLYDALGELPAQRRRCVLLHLGQDLKYREVAFLMHTSVNTVKSQIHRAKAQLHDKLLAHFAEPDPALRSVERGL